MHMDVDFSPIKKYLWSLDKDALDLKRDAKPIIKSILNFGDIQSIAWLFRHYDKKTISSVASSRRSGISAKSKNFLSLILSDN